MNRRRVLLAGAGFSANWGGLLSKDVGALLHSYTRSVVCANKDKLLTDVSYEEGWESIINACNGDENVKRAFEENLVKVFEFQQRILLANAGGGRLQSTGEWLQDLLAYQNQEGAIIVTTNQDTLLEEVRGRDLAPLTPGIGGISYSGTGKDMTFKVRHVPEDFVEPTFTNRNNPPLFKLHGSFDWEYNLRRLLVTGVSKRPEDWPVYLQGCLQWLENWLSERPVDLVIVGHSMADTYLTKLLAEACTDNWRVYIIDNSSPHNWFKGKTGFKQSKLMEQLQCFLPQPVSELVRPDHSRQPGYQIYTSQIRNPICGVNSG